MRRYLVGSKKNSTFAPAFRQRGLDEVWEWKAQGTLAQVVEQWTENPCVLGSTPRGTTQKWRG